MNGWRIAWIVSVAVFIWVMPIDPEHIWKAFALGGLYAFGWAMGVQEGRTEARDQ